ncbi:MAG: ABC transporter permease [Longimicrobiales bacterium]
MTGAGVPRDAVAVRLAVWCYRQFARLLPSGLRVEYGAALIVDFQRLVRRSHERSGVFGAAAAAVRGCADILYRVPVEYWHDRRGARWRRSAGAGGPPLDDESSVRPARTGMRDLMSTWTKELLISVRTLAKRPAFTLVAIGTLGLGIGATVAIFAVINAVLLRPLPYPESERIVVISHHAPGLELEELRNSPVTIRLYREHARTLAPVAATNSTQRNLLGGDRPARIDVVNVSPEFFDVVRTAPVRGRPFVQGDAEPGATPVAILTHGGWQSRFGGVPDVIGQVIELDGVRTEIVGVMPERFYYFDAEPIALLPLYVDPNGQFGAFGMTAVARLTPGVELDDARREAEALQARLPELFSELTTDFLEQSEWRASVTPLRDVMLSAGGPLGKTRDVRAVLWVVFGTVAFVLLIACANVANLFLVRAEGRRREFGVRSALGASRARLAASILSESVLLGVAGGVVGMALAAVGVRLLVASEAAQLPRLHEVTVDGATLVFAAAVSLVASLVFGALPLPRFLGARTGFALREGGRGDTGSRERHRARKTLIVGQVALALVLLTSSGLMVRSLQRLNAVDPGMRPDNVLTVGVSRGDRGSRQEAALFYQRVVDEVASLPGVTSAGASNSLPISVVSINGSSFDVQSRPRADDAVEPVVMYSAATPGFLEALGIPLARGRTIERRDHEAQAHVVWVNETFARRFLGDDPLAERIRISEDSTWLQVAGVVGDVRTFGLDEDVRPMAYLPMTTTVNGVDLSQMVLAIHATGDPSALAPAVRGAIERIAPEVPLTTTRTMESIVERSLAERSFTMTVLAIAALIALVLGAVGLYGVISYVASQRTREIGLRIALGALPSQVRARFVRQGLGVVAAGLGIGLAAALALTRLLDALLFEVSATDPLTFIGAVIVLTAVSLLATYLPARRASSIDPQEALRVE